MASVAGGERKLASCLGRIGESIEIRSRPEEAARFSVGHGAKERVEHPRKTLGNDVPVVENVGLVCLEIHLQCRMTLELIVWRLLDRHQIQQAVLLEAKLAQLPRKGERQLVGPQLTERARVGELAGIRSVIGEG